MLRRWCYNFAGDPSVCRQHCHSPETWPLTHECSLGANASLKSAKTMRAERKKKAPIARHMRAAPGKRQSEVGGEEVKRSNFNTRRALRLSEPSRSVTINIQVQVIAIPSPRCRHRSCRATSTSKVDPDK